MTRLEQRLRIEDDGTIVVLSGKVEYGQGLRAAYARIVAEELGVDPARVRVVLGDTDVVPWDMGTFGSMSVEMDGEELRRAAAFARTLLATRAPLEGEIPDDVPLAMREISEAMPEADAVAFVTGRVELVGDVRVPGMLHGCVVHAPVHASRLVTIDRSAAESMPGVVAIVHDGGFAGVVADTRAHALAARRALAPKWEKTNAPRRADRVTMQDGAGVEDAMAHAARRVARRYYVPHAANAPLGPSAGVADVRADEAFVWATTQRPFALRDDVAAIAHLDPKRVHFRPSAMSGGYGRHSSGDAAIEAARLSVAVKRPVSVQWTREDEFLGAPHRPETTAELEAGLDASGAIVAWRFSSETNPYTYGLSPRPGSGWSPAQMTANMCGRCAVPAYALGAARVDVNVAPAEIRTGAMRSLGAFPNVFAIESFVDELAAEAGADPISFRLRHASDAKLRRVIEAVRDASRWDSRAREPGRGFGVACAVYRNTYVAEVVEVSVAGDVVRFERAWCAIDAGHVVHHDGARNQIEGAIQMAASWTLLEELRHDDGAVLARTLDDYPIARCTDAPHSIDVVFVGDDTSPSAGMGEPPAVPIGAAIANAVHAATGIRARELPLRLR